MSFLYEKYIFESLKTNRSLNFQKFAIEYDYRLINHIKNPNLKLQKIFLTKTFCFHFNSIFNIDVYYPIKKPKYKHLMKWIDK